MKILVSAESFGYGPIATCLNVIKELIKYPDVIVDFIGSGISLEQAKMSGYFNEFYECDTFDMVDLEKHKDVFLKYDIYFSSENINGAIFSLDYIKNVYYVDNLVWMWDEIPEKLGKVKKFFISETFSCKENFDRVGHVIDNPIFLGPVRNLKNSYKGKTKNQLIINLGGASSFLFDQTIINKFYNKIINEILSTNEINKFDKIIICGGSKVINNIKLDKENDKVFIKTLSNEEYLKCMQESSHCIMSSGLGNFIETINENKNIMYLPAINYSQMLQLNYYRKMDFGFDILNWDNFNFYKEIPMYLDEKSGVDMVLENIKQYLDYDYKESVNKIISKYLNSNQEKYFEKRNTYFNEFEKDAAFKIAKIIYEENK
ncbi:MAG: hypothetical protein E7169_04185 [Firmicutes bacterium]|nr:hypothetical protein [Bacillota bacterium]